SNSVSRRRAGFSPSVVRQSVQRERILPAMCWTSTATLFDSGSRLFVSSASSRRVRACSPSVFSDARRARALRRKSAATASRSGRRAPHPTILTRLWSEPHRVTRRITVCSGWAMALTHVSVRIANPARARRFARVKFLVDSGAIYSVVPARTLDRLGVKPHSRRTFVLADGSEVTRRMGDAVFRLDGRQGASPVVFGEQGDSTRRGTVTLE